MSAESMFVRECQDRLRRLAGTGDTRENEIAVLLHDDRALNRRFRAYDITVIDEAWERLHGGPYGSRKSNQGVTGGAGRVAAAGAAAANLASGAAGGGGGAVSAAQEAMRAMGMLNSPGPIPATVPPPAPAPLPTAMVAGPTTAYRLYRLRRFASGWRLGAVGQSAWFTPGVPEKAKCVKYDSHDAPVAMCACGWYAVKQRAALEAEARYTPQNDDLCLLIGQVALWGRVIEHEKGYRAEYAYPVSLTVWNKVALPPGFPVASGLADSLGEVAALYGCTQFRPEPEATP